MCTTAPAEQSMRDEAWCAPRAYECLAVPSMVSGLNFAGVPSVEQRLDPVAGSVRRYRAEEDPHRRRGHSRR